MKKIYSKEQLEELREYPIEVINSMSETIEILDDNYGANRNIDNDLGGYVLVPEYTDIIECTEEVNWTSSLFLLSSDVVIIVVTTEELSKFLLE